MRGVTLEQILSDDAMLVIVQGELFVRFSGAATIEQLTIYRVCWDPLQTRKVYK